MAKVIKKALVIRPRAIGDVLHCMPTCRAMKAIDIEVDFLTDAVNVPLIEPDPAINRVYSLSKEDYRRYFLLFKLAKRLAKNEYDAIVNLQPSTKTRFLAWGIRFLSSSFPRIVTYKKKRDGRRYGDVHVVRAYFDTIRSLSDKLELPDSLQMFIPEETMQCVKEDLEKLGIKEFIALVPGVSKPRKNKRWPKAYWKELIEYLSEKRTESIVIIGGPQEQLLAEELINVAPDKVFNFCGKYDLQKSAGLVSLAKLAIGGDTGLIHASTALGAKTIGLYGPMDPKNTGLYGTQDIYTIESPHKCRFCNDRKCHAGKNTYAACMEAISVEVVVAKIAEIL